MNTSSARMPFGGVRILDCCQGLAGPTATMYLADFGADVVKVEPPKGDYLAADPAYLVCNRGKRRRSIDLTDHSDRTELRRLIGAADCVVVDWDRVDLEHLGLDAATVRSEYPGIVHAWIPPFGPSGRWSHLPPDPLLLAAVSGISDYHRASEERPVSPVVPVATYAHGALAAAGIAAALLERLRVGTGRSLVISGLHAVAAMQAAVMVDMPGVISPGRGPKGSTAGLPNYAAYRCADGRWLYLGALTQGFFLTALDVLGLLELMTLPGVDGIFANVVKPDVAPMLIGRLQQRFAERNRAEWLEPLDRAGVPVAPVGRREEWFTSETVAANQMRVARAHPDLGQVDMPSVPVVLSETPGMAGELPTGIASRDSYWECGSGATDPDPTTVSEFARPDRERLLPLRGLRVIDAASFVAGTFGPSILAHYGASVTKVEPPDGDPYRLFSASFAAINQGKRGIVIDLKHAAGKTALLRMVGQADVFVENLRDRSRSQLGLDWVDLQAVNPQLVHCSVGAYGHGPLSEKPGFDPLLQARSGLMAAQGGADEPSSSSMLVHDIGTGAIAAAIGIVTALYHRETSGRGQHVRTSLAHSSLMLQAGEFTTYEGRPPAQVGSRDWSGPSPLRRLYQCADGWLFLAATAEQAGGVRQAMGLDAGGGSPSAEDISAVLRPLSVVAALDRLDTQAIAAARVLSRLNTFSDPWLLENRFYHIIDDSGLGRCRVIRTLTDWSDSADTPDPRSFALGEDTREVLADYGFDTKEVAELLHSGDARSWSSPAGPQPESHS